MHTTKFTWDALYGQPEGAAGHGAAARQASDHERSARREGFELPPGCFTFTGSTELAWSSVRSGNHQQSCQTTPTSLPENLKAGVELPLGCGTGGEQLEQTAGQHSIALAAARSPAIPAGHDGCVRPASRPSRGMLLLTRAWGGIQVLRGWMARPRTQQEACGSAWKPLWVS